MVSVYVARIICETKGTGEPRDAASAHRAQSEAARELLWRALLLEHPECRWPSELSKDGCGKPFLPMYPDIYINLSHSGEFAACSIADHPTGVDVQQKRKLKVQVESRFHPEEKKLLDSVPKGVFTDTFYDIWTRKESYIKAVGKGLRVPLGEFSTVSEKEISGRGLLRDVGVRVRCGSEENISKGSAFYVRTYTLPDSGYSLAACGAEEGFATEAYFFWIFMDQSGKINSVVQK